MLSSDCLPCGPEGLLECQPSGPHSRYQEGRRVLDFPFRMYYVCMDKEEGKISVSKAVMMGCPFDLQRLTATNSCLLGTTKKQ